MRQLIGDVHWLSDGFQKEEIIREFLRRHLPPSLRISRGFVCPAQKSDRVSPEVDILVTDTESELPWLVEGGLAIVPPSCVVAHIHVKTTFKTATLIDVLNASLEVYRSCESNKAAARIWSCGVFFEPLEACSVPNYGDMFRTCLKRFLGDHQGERLVRHLPDCIAMINGPVLLSDKDALDRENAPVKMRLFNCGKMSMAVMLTNLYDSIQQRGRDLTRRGEWVQVVQKENFELVEEMTI